VRELLISGGDPLILPDNTIRKLLALFRTARPDIVIRIGTRMPVVLPSRITGGLAALLGSCAPLFVITQFNHPLELAPPAVEAAARLSNAGVVLLNQSVLLRGVNDSEEVIRRLSAALLSARIIPYYLFQGDLASGTAHLRAPMSKGISIMRSLRQRLSGLATPAYAVDLPGGGGKWLIPLEPPPERADGFYRIRGPGGRIWLYPDEEQEVR
jgi:lysine 2,3-aminomutase